MSDVEPLDSVTSLRPFWRRVRLKVLLHHGLFLLLLGLALGVLGTKLHGHVAAAEAWIASFGAWSIVVFVGLFVILTSVFVPDTVLALAAGVLFGLPQGIAAVCIGGLVSAAVQYALGRHLLKPRIERLLTTRPRLAAIQNAVRQQEVRLQVLLRALVVVIMSKVARNALQVATTEAARVAGGSPAEPAA